MIFHILLLGLGLVFLLWPQLVSGISETRRRRRLAALDRGAPEEFFEERRALEAYPARRSGLAMWRVLGALMVMTMLGLLFLPL